MTTDLRMALAALLRRRTYRQYEPDYQIPKDILEKIVNAALLSPTANNKQGIDLVVVTNRAKLDELSKASFDTWPDGPKGNFSKRTQDYGVTNVVTCDASAVLFLVKNERADAKFIGIDAGIITQSIIVAAQEFGLESMCIGVFLWGDPSGVEKLLGVPPGSLAMAVAIGKGKPNPKLLDKELLAKATFLA
jgi:nitroreductase